MCKQTLSVSLTCLLAATWMAGCGEHSSGSDAGQPSGPDSEVSASASPSSAVSVQTLPVLRRDLVKKLSLPANISPWSQATLFAKVPGYLKWVGADKGDEVKAGQLLAVIEAPEIAQQLQQAEADYRIKHLTYQRLHNVWKSNPDVVAKQDVDVAESAAIAARHVRDSHRTLLGYTRLSAPFAGTITARFADPGALIQSATGSATQAAPLFTLMDLTKLRIYVSVPQEAALLARPGTKAVVTARELPEKEFHTTIARTTRALDPATRTLLVELNMDNHQYELRPGMFVTAHLILEEHRQVPAVPPAALVTNGHGKAVFVVDNARAKLVPVKTGLDDGLWVEITEGLTDGMEIIVVGKTGLVDGQSVRTSPYSLPAGQPASQKM